MTAAAIPPTLPRRQFPRLQFSLRLLFVALTIVAIGFPIWYRWPYTEEDQIPPDKSSPPQVVIVTTWRRTWGGGREKHGPCSREMANGGFRAVEHYENDVRSGPYVEYYKGIAGVTGQHVAGRRSGLWIHSWNDGEVRVEWKEGRRHGPTEFRRSDGSLLALNFNEGVLTEMNGQPLSRSWADLEAEIKRDSPRLARCLDEESVAEFIETPLKDVVEILCDMHCIPGLLRVDRSGVNADLPITCLFTDIDLFSMLTVLAYMHDLGCDHRYGRLWFTSPADADQWTDPTGVASIQPPAGTPLAAIWREPVSINATPDKPLAEMLETLARSLGIVLDLTQIAPTADNPHAYGIRCKLEKHPFHHTLGILLYETGCRCRLEGERLVILPPEILKDERE